MAFFLRYECFYELNLLCHHPCSTPPNAPDISGQPIAAVALIVVENSVSMMRRAEKEGDPGSGHMAFPGGRYEPDDLNLRRGRLNAETWEEVGVELPNRNLFRNR